MPREKKAPKTEPVAPSYPPGTLGNLLVKTSRVRQFLGGPPTKNGPGAKKCGQNTPTGSCYSKSRHFCGAKGKKSAKNRAGGAKLPPPGTLGNLLVKTSRVRQFLGGPATKNGPERKNAVKTPQPGLVIQKVDTFAVSLQKKAPKTEPVAPSYPPGTLGNLLVKTSRVRQFLGGPPTKNSPGAKKCGQNTPTGSCYSKSRHFCGVIAKKSAKNRAGGTKLPPRYFGKPACENQ